MFDRIKKSLRSDDGASPTAARQHSAPDLSAVPPFPAELPGGLAVVNPALVGGYIGLAVSSVSPLGGEPEVDVGESTKPSAQSNGAAEHSTAPPPVGGQSALQEELMRANGMTDDQIAMIRNRISEAAAQHQQHAWLLTFANGRRASVQVFPLADHHDDFTSYKSRFDGQSSRNGGRERKHKVLDVTVHQVAGAHYETYQLAGVVVAKGREHEAVAKASQLLTPHDDRILAALAALGLWVVEG